MNLFLSFLATIFIAVILISRYKRCPANMVLVVFNLKNKKIIKCLHGKGSFVWPFNQDFAYLDLTPIKIEVELKDILSIKNNNVSCNFKFKIAISSEPGIKEIAAEKLIGLSFVEIQNKAYEILYGQLRLVISDATIDEISSGSTVLVEKISKDVSNELKRIGLNLIDVKLIPFDGLALKNA